MEELFMKFVSNFDLQNLIAMGLILWWMLRPIKLQIKEIRCRFLNIPCNNMEPLSSKPRSHCKQEKPNE